MTFNKSLKIVFKKICIYLYIHYICICLFAPSRGQPHCFTFMNQQLFYKTQFFQYKYSPSLFILHYKFDFFFSVLSIFEVAIKYNDANIYLLQWHICAIPGCGACASFYLCSMRECSTHTYTQTGSVFATHVFLSPCAAGYSHLECIGSTIST